MMILWKYQFSACLGCLGGCHADEFISASDEIVKSKTLNLFQGKVQNGLSYGFSDDLDMFRIHGE
jgi:hypothetical protein